MAVIVYGGNDSFNESAFHMPSTGTMQYLQQQKEHFFNSIVPTAQQFFKTVGSVYESISNSDAMRIARSVGRRVKSLWQRNEIRYLDGIGEVQNAPSAMVRWIMAEPTVHTLYHANGCDGYSHMYQDNSPGKIGKDHYDYRRVVDGLYVPDDEDGLSATTFYEEIDPEDELDISQKVDIIDTWEQIKIHLDARQDDPTSIYNASL